MKTFTQNNKSFLAMYVPEGASNFVATINKLTYSLPEGYNEMELPNTHNEIISLLSSVPESKAAEMVPEPFDASVESQVFLYFKYRTPEYGNYKLITATDSLKSRIESLGLDVSKPILLIEILK